MNQNKSLSNWSYFFVALTILLWGSSPAVIKLLLTNLNNFQVLFYNCLFATITLLGITFWNKKTSYFKSYTLKDYGNIIILGLLGVFLYLIFFYTSLMFTTAQEAFMVNYTWPVWIILFAFFILKEQITLQKIVAISLSFLGVYVVATKGDLLSFTFSSIKGDLLALLGAVSYGLYSVLGKKHDYEKFTSLTLYFALGTLLSLGVICLWFEFPTTITTKEIIGLIYLGSFTSALPYLFWFLALKHGDTAKMSNLIFLTPLVSLFFIYFLLDEPIHYSTFIALGLILGGLFIQSRK